MDSRIKAFLDVLSPEELDKFASCLDRYEEVLAIQKEAEENGLTVTQMKAASLLSDLVDAGFWDGIQDLSNQDLDEFFALRNDQDE